MPVKAPSGEVLGGLFFGHSLPGKFSAAVEASLASLAGQAALAMDNARLFHAREREIAAYTAIVEAERAAALESDDAAAEAARRRAADVAAMRPLRT